MRIHRHQRALDFRHLPQIVAPVRSARRIDDRAAAQRARAFAPRALRGPLRVVVADAAGLAVLVRQRDRAVAGARHHRAQPARELRRRRRFAQLRLHIAGRIAGGDRPAPFVAAVILFKPARSDARAAASCRRVSMVERIERPPS